MSKNEVRISLTKQEAIILFELLSRYSDSDKDNELQVLDNAERNSLWRLHGYFEKELSEPFLPNYLDILKAAKASLTTEKQTKSFATCNPYLICVSYDGIRVISAAAILSIQILSAETMRSWEYKRIAISKEKF